MIVYTLRCGNSHEFEDWFSSGAAFDRQAAGGELVCPVCASHDVEKAPMAPAVAGGKGARPDRCPAAGPDLPPCAGSCDCFPG